MNVTENTWAVVDGREITRDDIEKAFRRIGQTPPSNEETLTAKLNLLNDYIVQDILLARARAAKIELPDTELDAAYAEAKKNITEEQFKEELTRRNLTAADMREGLRRELLVQKVIERDVVSKVAVTDQDVSEFFNANRAQFNFPEEAYHIAQIVVTPVREPNGTSRERCRHPASRDEQNADADGPAEGRRAVRRSRARLLRGSGDGAARRRPRVRAGIGAEDRAAAAPRHGLELTPGSVRVVSADGAHTIVLLVAHEQAGQRDLSTPAVREASPQRCAAGRSSCSAPRI